jgi:hypothetical protein
MAACWPLGAGRLPWKRRSTHVAMHTPACQRDGCPGGQDTAGL